MRLLLYAEAFLTLLVYGGLVGHLWRRRYWPTRLAWIGGALVLLYVLLGQHKAYLLDIPFDAYSWVGVIAYAVLLTGLLAVRRSVRRRTRRQFKEDGWIPGS